MIAQDAQEQWGKFEEWLFKRSAFYAGLEVLPRHRHLVDSIYVLKDCGGGLWDGLRIASAFRELCFIFDDARGHGKPAPTLKVLSPRFGYRRRRHLNGWIFGLRSRVSSSPRLVGHEAALASCADRLGHLLDAEAFTGNVLHPIDALLDELLRDPENRQRMGESSVEELFDRCPVDATVTDVASAVGQSARTLQRKFKASTGISPKQFLEVRRFGNAMAAMMKKDARLSEIAGRLGYADQAHLTREFRRHTGIAPTVFQRLWQEGVIFDNHDSAGVTPNTRVKHAFWTAEPTRSCKHLSHP